MPTGPKSTVHTARIVSGRAGHAEHHDDEPLRERPFDDREERSELPSSTSSKPSGDGRPLV